MLAAIQRMVYPYKWLPVRPTFFHWATSVSSRPVSNDPVAGVSFSLLSRQNLVSHFSFQFLISLGSFYQWFKTLLLKNRNHNNDNNINLLQLWIHKQINKLTWKVKVDESVSKCDLHIGTNHPDDLRRCTSQHGNTLEGRVFAPATPLCCTSPWSCLLRST